MFTLLFGFTVGMLDKVQNVSAVRLTPSYLRS